MIAYFCVYSDEADNIEIEVSSDKHEIAKVAAETIKNFGWTRDFDDNMRDLRVWIETDVDIEEHFELYHATLVVGQRKV